VKLPPLVFPATAILATYHREFVKWISGVQLLQELHQPRQPAAQEESCQALGDL